MAWDVDDTSFYPTRTVPSALYHKEDVGTTKNIDLGELPKQYPEAGHLDYAERLNDRRPVS